MSEMNASSEPLNLLSAEPSLKHSSVPRPINALAPLGPVSSPTELMKAVLANDLSKANKCFHEAGRFTTNGETALMMAAKRHQLSLVSLLLPQEKNMQDKDGYTALMYAACYNHVEIARLLTCELGKQTSSGWTALMLAVFHNSLGCIPLLLSEAPLRNRMGYTAQDLAGKGGRVEALQAITASPTFPRAPT
ncbi:Protein 21.1 [Giardia lamblia P15]|uniref:Protein 21.1 n=1 Tax=Giardia intestinalis (strain P15) TaxID=658858 RepID=E1F3Q2_GIAIA|nr:Protein 21.1 [Giardia lamblia P15]